MCHTAKPGTSSSSAFAKAYGSALSTVSGSSVNAAALAIARSAAGERLAKGCVAG